MHEANPSDCLLAHLFSSEDCASDDPIPIPPEPLPDPAPPDNFDNPQQLLVNAAYHFKLASSPTHISCDPIPLGFS